MKEREETQVLESNFQMKSSHGTAVYINIIQDGETQSLYLQITFFGLLIGN